MPDAPKLLVPLFCLFSLVNSVALAEPATEAHKPFLENGTINSLENRIAEIDDELNKLAEYSLRSGVGPVGYRSQAHQTPEETEWIQINLQEEATIDQIALVPTIWRNKTHGLQADGFPVEFQLFAGSSEDPQGELIADYDAQDTNLPRIAPLVIPFSPIKASWVRLEAKVLSPRVWDGLYILQLSEMLVFSGEENVALHQQVQVPRAVSSTIFARRKEYLVDGFVPYVMHSPISDNSLAFTTLPGIGEKPTLTIDLERSVPINRIHLHGPDLSDTVPQALPDDYGIARHWRVEGANKPDFSDATPLFEYFLNSIYDVGPIIMWSFPETTARYIRLTAVSPYFGSDHQNQGSQIALAEIEVFSNGKNVALGKRTTPNFTKIPKERKIAALTDGRNFYGQILPVRGWMEQLARRHELETERPLLLAKLNQHYARQSRILKWMGWLAAALFVGIIIIILVDRIIRMRHVARIKERFAADLHDELGANVHTIGLLSDLASRSKDSPEDLESINARIRQLTERTGTAIRHCTNMMEAKGLYIGLVDDIRRTARRNIALLDHEITIEGEEHLEKLRPRTRVDLYLFYKECLINVCRHSGASKFATRLVADSNMLSLTFSDNGKGLNGHGQIPSSLARRARLLRAKLKVDTVPDQGTSVTLTLKTKRFGFRI